jgi:hypothetical protein
MYKNIISLLCKARSNTATKKYRLSDGTVIIKIDQLLKNKKLYRVSAEDLWR